MTADQKTPTKEREARVMSGWPMLVLAIALYVLGPVLIVYAFVSGTSDGAGGTDPVWSLFVGGCVALGVADPAEPRVLHHPAQRGARADPLRRLSRHLQAGRLPLGQPLLRQRPRGPGRQHAAAVVVGQEGLRRGTGAGHRQEAQALQGQPARPHAERRPAQGQRQARQPRGHRRRRGVARRRYGQGGLRRRRFRDVRGHPERDGGPAPRQRVSLRLGRDARRHRRRDHPARQRGRGLRGPARGAHRAARRRPVSAWSRPASRTSPTPRRSPRRCSAASRPRP